MKRQLTINTRSAPPAAPPARRSTGRASVGFTLSEAVLSLTILAVLLAAVGTAVKGTLTSYTENNEIAQVTQTARVVLNRMMNEVRTAQAVDSTQHGAWLNIIPPDNPELLTLIRYELANGTLYYRQTINGAVVETPLIASDDAVQVLGLDISRETALDANGVSYTVQVNACLTLQSGANPFYVSASICPRRNLSF